MATSKIVWVTNLEREQCVGLSFKHLKPGQRVKIDQEKITEADMRLINKGMAKISKYVASDESPPVPANVPDPVIDHDGKEPEAMITGEVIDGKSSDKEAEIVTPSGVEASASEPVADSEQPADETEAVEPMVEVEQTVDEIEVVEPVVETTAYSREELSVMSRNELRAIGEPLGVTGKAKEKLIDDILKSQAE